MLGYIIFFSQTKLENKIIKEQDYSVENVKHLIENHILLLKKEVYFIASLDVMDDILADDLDKRISILLTKKAKDLSLDVTLSVINLKAKIIASSNKSLIDKTFKAKVSLHEKYMLKKKKLYIFAPIYASFERTKQLGYLILEYNLDNLDRYLTHNNGIHSSLEDASKKVIVGDVIPAPVQFSQTSGSFINTNVLVVYTQLHNELKDFYLVYGVDKDRALKFLYDFRNFMFYITILVVLIIIYIAIKYSKSIVKPIENLTSATNQIIKTKDYATALDVTNSDEIATLTHSFNKMIHVTKNALEALEIENKLRLKRFVQLIEVFNTITQTTDENECMAVSIEEIKKITGVNQFQFATTHAENSIDIYVTDFENNQKKYFGSIVVVLENANERKFYNAIAAMIAYQLDRIRLIEKTMQVSNTKSAFISHMSHELRTPLNAIIGSTQYLLVYEAMSEEQQDAIINIEKSATYLLGMINDILDIAKIEAGKMQLHYETVDINDVIHNVYDMLQVFAEEKDLEFIWDKSEGDMPEVYTDVKILQQIMINLISNAIKFTQSGYVKVESFYEAGKICVRVSDSGMGIEKKDLNLLFNDFVQVENIMQKKHKGSGLGLSLSQKMAQLLGGDINLFSDGAGHGSQAILCIPLPNQAL
jgi:signal transduction histidine kinase